MKLYGFASAGMNAPDGYLSLNTTVWSSGAVTLSTMMKCAAGAGDALRREDDLLERGDHVLRGQRRAVVEFHALADLEGVGLAAVGRLRHLGAQVADEIRRRRRIVRIDPDEHAVERRERVDQRERGLAVTVQARRLVGNDEGQNAALSSGFPRCAGPTAASGRASAAAIGKRVSDRLLFISSSLDFCRAPSSCSPGASTRLRFTPVRSRRDLNFRTGDPMAGPHFSQLRHGPCAFVDGHRAARMEHAAGRRVASGSAPRP